jgi:hypothetical protein
MRRWARILALVSLSLVWCMAPGAQTPPPMAPGGLSPAAQAEATSDRAPSSWSRVYRPSQGGSLSMFTDLAATVCPDGFAVASNLDDPYRARGTWNQVLRLDGSGEILWSALFLSEFTDRVHDLDAAPDGTLLVGGVSQNDLGWDLNAWVIKFGYGGEILWARSFGLLDRSETLSRLRATPDGGCLFIGSVNLTEESTQDYVTRLDGEGQVLWANTYTKKPTEKYRGVEVLADGGFLITGRTYAANGMLVMRLDSGGRSLWRKAIPCGSNGFATCSAQLSDGGFAIGGWEESWGNYTPRVARLASSGKPLWSRTFAMDGFSVVHAVFPGSDGGIGLAGELQTAGPGAHAGLLQVDSSGMPVAMWDAPVGLVSLRRDLADGCISTAFHDGDLEVVRMDSALSGGAQCPAAELPLPSTPRPAKKAKSLAAKVKAFSFPGADAAFQVDTSVEMRVTDLCAGR